jgi:tetratricopeptide (TPR) repeat protein
LTDRSGEVLAGRYRLLRELGSGGMGTVYLAEHVHLGRRTAVKLLHRELCCEPDAEARFRREALLAARIAHGGVAQVYDFDCTPEGEFLLAMEFVEGETVAERVRRHGAFPIPLALEVLSRVADGLDAAHGMGILHRDLKPENVMLAPGGLVKLLDFGVARSFESTSSVTSEGFAVGTPAYMSPEQLVGEALTAASDIYALGAVFYEMLTAQQPHSGKTFAELRARRLAQPAAPAHLLRAEVPAALSDVIARALDVEPKARWPTATAFARAAAEAAGTAPPPPVSVAPRAGRGRVSLALDRWESHFEALRFAGREREIRQVRDAWAAARAGRSMLLWIEGDEGAGKSSFFDLAQREARNDGAAEVTGRGYEADVVRPYGPMLGMLRRALGLPGAEARDWPSIEALTDARVETPAPDRAVLYDEVTVLVRAAAGRGPLLVGLEDLDWCDAASVSLFEFLAHDISEVPLLLAASVVQGRGGEPVRAVRERMRRLEHAVWVALRPLGYEAVASWLSRALGREAPEELVRFVYGHTEGNAFFIEQVVRSLIERGELEKVADAGFRLAEAPPPEAVTDVVQRRLKGMSAAAREILQIAAVVGREFDVDLLLQVATRGEDAVLNAVDEAVLAGVLAAVQRPHGDWYRFTHGKLGHVLAQAMNARRRRKLHGQLAEALAQRSDAPAGSIAWHWYQAGQAARASTYARAACRQALRIHDYDDAVTFAVMAAETAQSAAEQAEAHELRGDALRRLDRYAEAAAAYARARLGAGGGVGPDAAANLRRKELRCALMAGTVSSAAAAAEAGKLAEGATSQPAARRAAVQILLAEALVANGEAAPAVEAARRAEAAAREAGDRPQEGDALLVLGQALLARGELAGADRAARSAQAIFNELGDPYSTARAATLLGQAAATARDLATARAAFDDALKQAERARVTRLIRQIREKQAAMERV